MDPNKILLELIIEIRGFCEGAQELSAIAVEDIIKNYEKSLKEDEPVLPLEDIREINEISDAPALISATIGDDSLTILMGLARRISETPGELHLSLLFLAQISRLYPDSIKPLLLIAELEAMRENQLIALAALQAAAEISPDDYEIIALISLLYMSVGDAEKGMDSLLRATAMAPNAAKLRYYQAKALLKLGDYDQALAAFIEYKEIESISLLAEDTQWLIGICYLMTVQLDKSLDSIEEHLSRYPDDPDALIAAHNAYRNVGEISKSINCCERVLENRRFRGRKEEKVSFYNLMLTYSTQGKAEIDNIKRRTGIYWENLGISQALPARVQAIEGVSTGKLKIGILTGEAGSHVVSFFLEPLLRNYPKGKIELDLIIGRNRHEDDSQKLIQHVDGCLNICGLPLKQAREAIRARHYDIIIETSGFTANTLVELLAQRCAPLQCHYIGYHATTGLETIDYFIGDNVFTPGSVECQFREKILRIGVPWISRYIQPDLPLAYYTGSHDKIVMASTNQAAKIGIETLGYWSEALLAIPESILVVKDRFALSGKLQSRIISFLRSKGVDSERISFVGANQAWQEHMLFYNSVDLVLDATPWSASTTAFDVLSMGAPFVGICGDVSAARMSSSILKASDHEDWIATNEIEFVGAVKKIVDCISDYRVNRAMHQSLNLQTSLFDPVAVADRFFNCMLELGIASSFEVTTSD